MEKKKLKLSISGSANKTISSIEKAKSKSKNTVFIEKKAKRFSGKPYSPRPNSNTNKLTNNTSFIQKKSNYSKPFPDTSSDFEKRKLAEQRATRRIKGEIFPKDSKPNKLGGKRRELKLTISRALSDEEMGTKSRSLASLKRAKQKENRTLNKDENKEILKPIKRNVNIPELITIRELANRMTEQSSNIIKHLLGMGVTVTINHTIDSDTAEYLVKEFGHNPIKEEKAEEIIEKIKEVKTQNLKTRAPIVTVMGHVDHGKTSLLDYIRSAEVTAGEAGGITQHIGAYSVTHSDKVITFLDTPGHEAFTAMRARGAQVTDVAIIIVAADDKVMPQTKEAINHAQAAGVPMVFALNKCDRPSANPDKIKEELSAMNILVEDWGGKYQCQEVSAKTGDGIEELLEKVLLEAELLELKADPGVNAVGTVIEASLDKGRGYVTTLLVQYGMLRVGDALLAGTEFGKIKALHDEYGRPVKEAGPSKPVSVLGMNGAASAGDSFNVMNDEKEIKQIASKRQQLQREQGLRTTKHITLDEIGRRIALGDFQELNIIVKGDVDGSIEALSDSLLKLSHESIQINVIHKAVGQITESDILLASASDAIVVGFQVRPSAGARKLAEKEEIDVRLYSVIYKAIDEIKEAMEGMLSPDFKEEIVGTAEIRETFKISKVGTIAGCFVTEGKINRNNNVRVIRDGIVIYTGLLGSLKRFKDDVKEVQHNYECGLNIEKYNDIKVGDVVEAFQEVEVAKKL